MDDLGFWSARIPAEVWDHFAFGLSRCGLGDSGKMSAMDPFTPQSLFDLYSMLPDESKIQFLRLVGRSSPPTAPLMMVGEMSRIQQVQFFDHLRQRMGERVMPQLVAMAIDMVRAAPDGSREALCVELEKRFHAKVHETVRLFEEVAEKKMKAKRDRKSAPDTIKCNVEICELRRRDPKHWSQGKLAKKFGITARAVRAIIADEAKWRSQLPTESEGD